MDIDLRVHNSKVGGIWRYLLGIFLKHTIIKLHNAA